MEERRIVDRAFRITLSLKALDAILEILGGLLLSIVGPEHINTFVQSVTQHQLSNHPDDFVARHLNNSLGNLSTGSVRFAAFYLLSHGAVKLFLIVEVWKNKLWAYPWLICVLGLFVIYQFYRLTFDFGWGLVLLTGFDLTVIWLTYLEWRTQEAKHKELTL